MKINRRQILGGTGLATLKGMALADAGAASAQPASGSALAAQPNVEQRLIGLARQNLYPITFAGGVASGPGWDFLVRNGREAEFVLLGEEHGMVETPLLARDLFLALRPAGFDTVAIEISPPIAQDLDSAARGGVKGIAAFCAAYPPGPAFYFWKTEAEFIAAVRAAVPGNQDVLWGLDYEVTGDRRLIERLKAKAPPSASAALDRLDKASLAAGAAWRQTHNPAVLFTFSGDPTLVRAVRAAWPRPDADAEMVLATLEQTLAINALWPAKDWESNLLRAQFNRKNLAAHLNRAAAGRKPRVLFKMGESHMMRGISWVGVFDVGSLVPEAAALRGGKAVSFLVGGGRGGRHGVLNPTNMSVADAPVDMFSELGLQFLVDGLAGDDPVLVDMRPMRPVMSNLARVKAFNNEIAIRTIFSFDAMLIWNGSTATQMLNG